MTEVQNFYGFFFFFLERLSYSEFFFFFLYLVVNLCTRFVFAGSVRSGAKLVFSVTVEFFTIHSLIEKRFT